MTWMDWTVLSCIAVNLACIGWNLWLIASIIPR